jgi:hypothetical protein
VSSLWLTTNLRGHRNPLGSLRSKGTKVHSKFGAITINRVLQTLSILPPVQLISFRKPTGSEFTIITDGEHYVYILHEPAHLDGATDHMPLLASSP